MNCPKCKEKMIEDELVDKSEKIYTCINCVKMYTKGLKEIHRVAMYDKGEVK